MLNRIFSRLPNINKLILNPSIYNYTSQINQVDTDKHKIQNPTQNMPAINTSQFSIPAQDKERGEDAIQVNNNIMTVCDGVGGWQKHNIDPYYFSNDLAIESSNYLRDNFNQNKFLSYINNNMNYNYIKQIFKESIDQGLTKTIEQGNRGSTTICMNMILNLNIGTFLLSGNIGDSGQCIIRDGVVIYTSEYQQQQFNFPQQIGQECEETWEIDTQIHKLEKGDIVILGSDGLWDNLQTKDIENIYNEVQNLYNQESNEEFKDIFNKTLFNTAVEQSLDEERDCPFSVKGREACDDKDEKRIQQSLYGKTMNKNQFQGGKMDDISIVVSEIY